ncbi:hypothetical protein ABZP36_001761 [Zizania latifolia]
MASVGFGTTFAPAAVASPSVTAGRGLMSLRPSSARVARPSATKSVAAATTEEKGLFETIFGALYKEEQLLETDPVLNKVEGKATKAAGAEANKAAGDVGGGGGFSFGGLFSKKE